MLKKVKMRFLEKKQTQQIPLSPKYYLFPGIQNSPSNGVLNEQLRVPAGKLNVYRQYMNILLIRMYNQSQNEINLGVKSFDIFCFV